MARLSLSLLGPFQATLDEEPVTAFESNRVRALLAYLAVEADRPHRRDTLAGLLWPDWPDTSARTNLRNALANLRTSIRDREATPPHLLITRETIQFNSAGDHWLDVSAFRAAVEAESSDSERLEEALSLYRGPFLEGFAVEDSAAYEDWAQRVREQMERQTLSALDRLVAGYEGQGEIERAIEAARRQVALAPWQESAHRQLMRLLDLNGERSAALAQYEVCRRLLREELDVEPSAETTRLYERIRDGAVQPAPHAVRLETPKPELPRGTVTFLFTDIQGSTPLWERKPQAMAAAVARHHALLRQAIEANGGIVFKVIGDEFQAAFDLAPQGLAAALAAQRVLLAQEWGETGPLRVRMGLHTGPAEVAQEGDERADYAVSHTLNRAARVMTAGHGGQILLSQEAADLVRRDLPPGVSLRDLGEHRVKGMAYPERFFQVVASDLAQEFPPLTTVDQPRHNLPAQLIPFVGREETLAEIEERLRDSDCRLLTLVGLGGSGKTRLALEAAARQAERFADGVFFVALAPLQSVEAIVPTVAQAIGFTFYSGVEPKEQLLNYLRQKNALLVLDNFEHLVEGAELVPEILRAASEVVVLVTSRSGLHVQGEHRFPVSGMSYPALTPDPSPVYRRGGLAEDALRTEDALEYSAVRLFAAGARRARPDFELTGDNMADVIRICRLVDGMPLALLLAAAWMELLTPSEISAEIERSFDVLETDLRDAPERQRSVRAVFEHSWTLLSERERAVLQVLSVFRGGFTLEAAGEVADASLRDLMSLVDRSLLQRTDVPSTPHADVWALRKGGRFEMHELLQQYATEKLDRSPADGKAIRDSPAVRAGEAARDRHCAYYAAALARWAAELKGPRQQAAMAEMEVEVENARAAWDWAVERVQERVQVERLGQAMEGLGLFYEWRARYEEGEAAFRAAAGKLAELGQGTARRAWIRALTWQAVLNLYLGRAEIARQLLQRSLGLLEGPEFADQDVRPEKAFVLREMGWIEHLFGTKEQARQHATQSLSLYRALGDRWAAANALSNLGFVAQAMGQFDEARRSHQEALAICRALVDQRGIARSLTEIGIALAHRGQFQEAERLIQESVTIERELGDRIHYATGLSRLAHVSAWKGEFVKSLSLSEEGWSVLDELGASVEATNALSQLGSAKAHLGQYDQAHVHLQRALALARVGAQRWAAGATRCFLGHVALAKEQYVDAQQWLWESADVFQKSGDRSDVGWPLALLAGAARGLDRLPTARELLCEALQISAEMRDVPTPMYALPVAALILADLGEAERAVEIYALASRYGFVANSRLWEDIAGREITALAATLPPDVVAAAQERGRARDLEATVKELLVELREDECGSTSSASGQ